MLIIRESKVLHAFGFQRRVLRARSFLTLAQEYAIALRQKEEAVLKAERTRRHEAFEILHAKGMCEHEAEQRVFVSFVEKHDAAVASGLRAQHSWEQGVAQARILYGDDAVDAVLSETTWMVGERAARDTTFAAAS